MAFENNRMRFLPIGMTYNPETNQGSVELLEAIYDGDEWQAIGDLSISFPLSEDARGKIRTILALEQDRALKAISGI